MIKPALPNLHDTVLDGIQMDWQAATATLRFLSVEPATQLALVAKGVRELHIPLNEPWSQSNSVNVAEYVETPSPGEIALRVEMQSGDEITLRAESIEVS